MIEFVFPLLVYVIGLGYVVMRALQLVIKSTGCVQTYNHEQRIFEGAS